MDRFIAKAEVLLEALPYMQRFAGKTVVIKYGGHAMTEARLANGFAEDIVLLKSIGLAPVIVHGGGPQIGMRVTDAETMDVVEMVLGAKINKTIVGMIHGHGGKAVGLTGKDGHLLVAEKMKVRVKEEGKRATLVDVGQVGRVKQVNPEILQRIVGTDFIPVIAPIGIDEQGRSYNINADLAAAEIAKALGAAKLLLLTDVAGIKDGGGQIQPLLSAAAAKRQVRAGTIAEGMVPKVECAIDALTHGVRQVHIIDGRVSHAVLLEIFTERGVGTEVLLKEPPAPKRKASARGGKKKGTKKKSAGGKAAKKQATARTRAGKAGDS